MDWRQVEDGKRHKARVTFVHTAVCRGNSSKHSFAARLPSSLTITGKVKGKLGDQVTKMVIYSLAE